MMLWCKLITRGRFSAVTPIVLNEGPQKGSLFSVTKFFHVMTDNIDDQILSLLSCKQLETRKLKQQPVC